MIQDILKKQRIEGEKDEVTNINTESDRARVVTYGRKGLLNIGNTCFMNAAIQVFSNIKPLREFLFSLDSTNVLDKPRNVENQLDRANSIRVPSNCLLQKYII